MIRWFWLEKLKRKVLEWLAEEDFIARIATNPKDYTAYESWETLYGTGKHLRMPRSAINRSRSFLQVRDWSKSRYADWSSSYHKDRVEMPVIRV